MPHDHIGTHSARARRSGIFFSSDPESETNLAMESGWRGKRPLNTDCTIKQNIKKITKIRRKVSTLNREICAGPETGGEEAVVERERGGGGSAATTPQDGGKEGERPAANQQISREYEGNGIISLERKNPHRS